MKELEVKEQMARISKYRDLEKVRDETDFAIKQLTEPWESGPCGQGPFTGNTRESRQVRSIHIWFSPTRGGAPEVDMCIRGLRIEAWELGKDLEAMLQVKLDAIHAEMEKL